MTVTYNNTLKNGYKNIDIKTFRYRHSTNLVVYLGESQEKIALILMIEDPLNIDFYRRIYEYHPNKEKLGIKGSIIDFHYILNEKTGLFNIIVFSEFSINILEIKIEYDNYVGI